jgi:hypothetical protein
MSSGGCVVAADEAGFPLQFRNERVKRAVLMVWRAEVTQAVTRLAGEPLLEGREKARFADPRLA